MEPRGGRIAPGAPGAPLPWAPSAKDGFGTAYSADSTLWFTVWRGIVTEIYYPTIDRPQTSGLLFVVTDGATFAHSDRHGLSSVVELAHPHALDYRVRSRDPAGRYTLVKDVLAAPHQPALLVRVRLEVHAPELQGKLRLFAIVAPRLGLTEGGTEASVYTLAGRPVLGASRPEVALAVAADVPVPWASVGYLGASDGLTELLTRYEPGAEYDLAPHGNVGMGLELEIPDSGECTVVCAFGPGLESASTTLLQALGTAFQRHRDRFVLQWHRACRHLRRPAPFAGDGGRLERVSHMVLLASEDKQFPGAFIASPSTPWGWTRIEDQGGYHLVWTRDMVHTATALLASGVREAPLRALIYLASRQQADGGFPQNFWVDGRPYWSGLQLDEVAYPILLAWRLARDRDLEQFDPYPMVSRAARFLLEHGPVTPQDRWEEVSGFSPSTLALQIAGLLGASDFARRRGDRTAAELFETGADFLENHIEQWTVTDRGTLDPEVPRHYVRIRPALPGDPHPRERGDFGRITIANRAPDRPSEFPAQEIVSTEFLELVRYGIRPADDPVVVDSVRLVDRILRVETPFGPAWKRYTHDGYGQGPGGTPYRGWGIGRPWPLLTGERGHYELAAGRDPIPFAQAMERFATDTGLLTEQIWDEDDVSEFGLVRGRPTGAAMPLAWAHAEYLTLLRSIADREVFDRIPSVAERYGARTHPFRAPEIWKFNRQIETIPPGRPLRFQIGAPFRLHLSDDGWRTVRDIDAAGSSVRIWTADLPPLDAGQRYDFTFYWPQADRWEGRDFTVTASPDDRP
ncbi:MAG: glycoside hydrolase family 15 protein [Thermoplasmata archaeon]